MSDNTATKVVFRFIRSFFNLLANKFDSSASLLAQSSFWEGQATAQADKVKKSNERLASLLAVVEQRAISVFSYLDESGNAVHRSQEFSLDVREKTGVVNTLLANVKEMANGNLFASYVKFSASQNGKRKATARETFLNEKHGHAENFTLEGENTQGYGTANYALYDKKGISSEFTTAILESLALADKGNISKASEVLHAGLAGLECLDQAEIVLQIADDAQFLAMCKAKARDAKKAYDEACTAKTRNENIEHYLHAFMSESQVKEIIALSLEYLRSEKANDKAKALSVVKDTAEKFAGFAIGLRSAEISKLATDNLGKAIFAEKASQAEKQEPVTTETAAPDKDSADAESRKPKSKK